MPEWILQEANWIAPAVGLGWLAGGWSHAVRRRRGEGAPGHAASFGLAYGVTIGTMAFGHLLAVGVHLARGTLDGSPFLLIALGLGLGLPSGGLARREWPHRPAAERHRGRALWNLALAGLLLALGLHNLPLALFGILGALLTRPEPWWLRRATLVALLLLHAALFTGSLIFMARGQSFEELQGMEESASGLGAPARLGRAHLG